MSIPAITCKIFYFQTLLIFFLFFGEATSSSSGVVGCAAYNLCSDCIQKPDCGWCSKLKVVNESSYGSRCLKESELLELCDPGYEVFPENHLEILKNLDVVERRDGDTIQLQPQEMALDLRVGVPLTIEFKFKKANDYPIDLYYLLDFSKSMQEFKEKLSDLGLRLAMAMEKRTSKLRLGFGSFVDKVTLPYTSIHPDDLKSPCQGCASPYSYKNHLPLDDNSSKFSEKLRRVKMSANEDSPEGGFDALLQAMVCLNEINWRNQSRRIIVFCTDAPFHIAGDGKLGGVVEPHDGQCHLDESGDYTHALKLDYPSISLINNMAKKHSMNIIFVVTEKRKKAYEQLAEAIEGASVGTLRNTDDIINLVIQQYKNMSVSVLLTNKTTGSVGIKYSSKCPGQDWIDGKGCSSLKGGDEVHFRATLTVHECTSKKQSVEIKPVGMVDTLSVQLNVHCSCDCEEDGHKHYEEKSKSCSGSGALVCGRCECPLSHYGRHCECQQRAIFNSPDEVKENIDPCRRDNVTCSNRGTCVCGSCRCKQPSNPKWRVEGEFCECDNFSCDVGPGGVFCSGHGYCVCGSCQCEKGWGDSDCSCDQSTASCLKPEDIHLCSGRGKCQCGKCVCDKAATEGTVYAGDYCQRCVGCKVECDQRMHDCIACFVHYDGPLFPKCSDCEHVSSNITLVQNVTGYQKMTESSVLCRPIDKDENGCSFQYVAYFHQEEIRVLAEATKTCPIQVNIAAIVAGVTGSTVVAGLILLLLWKLITTVHDKREYQKFERQRADTKWGREDNPLYRKALTTHANPMFEG